MKLCVLGAGIVGLTTALELQKSWPNAKVTILAEHFCTDTTSDVAAGIFRPGTSFCGPNMEITRKWINDSYYYWNDILNSSEASLAGVKEISVYMLASSKPGIVKNHYLEHLLPIYRSVLHDEFKQFSGDWKYGTFFSTLLTECRIHQPWATNKFTAAGGEIIVKHVPSFVDLAGKYDVLVNCTGLGAKELCSDHKLVPIRGQIVKVSAPWLKTAIYGDSDTYILPGFHGIVTMGGTRQYDSFNLNICKYDAEAIKERCIKLIPRLATSPIIRETVGLRPHRDPVRVETEVIEAENAGPIKIVHNYGHGGYGVTTSPGTAKHAVKLVRDFVARSGSKL